jgi:hypothetical protein
MIHNSAPGRNYEYCLHQPRELEIIMTLAGVTRITDKLDKQVTEIRQQDTSKARNNISFKQTLLFCFASHFTFFLLVLFLNTNTKE